MKKLLALVLSLVMVLGLATVGANAAYSDDADISKDEAVAVMSAIKVFDGIDGAFQPTGTLTREMGAKIIASMIIGRTAADALANQATKFTDVAADRWSAGSIAFCTNEGIIGGVGDNKFDPTGSLTGYAFAKMALVALGYDPNTEGLVGESWQVNTAKLALSAGLTDNLDELTMSAPITREQAAQMALNTEEATMVEYSGGVTIGDVKVGGTRSEVKRTSGTNYLNGVTEGSNTTTSGDGTLQFCERYASKLTLTDAGSDDFGNPSNKWLLDGATVGTFENKSAALTYTKKMTSDANKRVIAKAIEDYDSTTTATVVVNGTTTNNANFTPTDTNIANLTNTGRLVKVFVTSNKISKITVTDTFLAKVAAVNSTTEQITLSFTTPVNGTAIANLATSKGYGTFVKDDYVLVTIDTNGDDLGVPDGAGNNTIASIKAANKVTGVASTKSSSGITIDGTVYPEAYTVVTGNALTNFGVNSQYEATLYTDDYGNFLYAKSGAAATSDKAVAVLSVYQATSGSNNKLVYMIEGVTSDGAKVNWYVGDTNPGLTANTVYNYTYNSSNNKYTLSQSGILLAISDANATNAATINLGATFTENKSDKSLTVTGTAYYDSNVKFIYVKGGDATVLDGVQTVAAPGVQAFATLKRSGGTNYVTAVYLIAEAPAVADSSADIIFVAKETGTYSTTSSQDGTTKTYATYNAYKEGQKISNFYAPAGAAAGFYSEKIDEYTGAYILSGNKYTKNTGTYAIQDSDGNTADAADGAPVAYDSSSNTILTDTNSVDYDLSSATVVDLISSDGSSYTSLAAIRDGISNSLLTAGDLSFYILYNTDSGNASYVYVMSSFAPSTVTYETHGLTVTFTPKSVNGDATKTSYKAGDTVIYNVAITGTSDDSAAEDTIVVGATGYTHDNTLAANGNYRSVLNTATAGTNAATQNVSSSYYYTRVALTNDSTPTDISFDVEFKATTGTIVPTITYASNITGGNGTAAADTAKIVASLANVDGEYDSGTVNYAVDSGGSSVNGFAIGSNKTLNVTEAYDLTVAAGTVNVATGGTLKVADDVILTGNLSVAGDATINGGIGTSTGTLTVASSGTALVKKGIDLAGGAATVNGELTVATNNNENIDFGTLFVNGTLDADASSGTTDVDNLSVSGTFLTTTGNTTLGDTSTTLSSASILDGGTMTAAALLIGAGSDDNFTMTVNGKLNAAAVTIALKTKTNAVTIGNTGVLTATGLVTVTKGTLAFNTSSTTASTVHSLTTVVDNSTLTLTKGKLRVTTGKFTVADDTTVGENMIIRAANGVTVTGIGKVLTVDGTLVVDDVLQTSGTSTYGKIALGATGKLALLDAPDTALINAADDCLTASAGGQLWLEAASTTTAATDNRFYTGTVALANNSATNYATVYSGSTVPAGLYTWVAVGGITYSADAGSTNSTNGAAAFYGDTAATTPEWATVAAWT